jgi:predicted dithiol-disulfide oxidoreductase (DUF899 family)
MQHQVVSRDEWLAARQELLRKEKEFTQLRDRLSAERRALPWVKVEKNYVFDGPNGKVTLAELFGGNSQLVVKHFMFGPDARRLDPSPAPRRLLCRGLTRTVRKDRGVPAANGLADLLGVVLRQRLQQ